MNEKFNVLGVHVDAVNPALAREKIDGWIERRQKVYVCVAPVSTIVACREDPVYQECVNQAAMVTPDGMPLVWLGRRKGHRMISRTYGPDLMLDVCRFGEERGYKHFFLGSTDATLEKLSGNLKAQFPRLMVAGTFSPPFSRPTKEEEAFLIRRINQTAPDILWVGLGSPKQDLWMKQFRGSLEVPVMVGVGAAFDIHAGVKKQAPRWMREKGLEWFFRLCAEPRRLWRRYLIGNTKFIYYLFLDALGLKSVKVNKEV